ncbi:MAG: matrixin family metalloprotease [Acidimicrobiales bacterium]
MDGGHARAEGWGAVRPRTALLLALAILLLVPAGLAAAGSVRSAPVAPIPAFFDPGPQPPPPGFDPVPPTDLPGTPAPGGGLELYDGGSGFPNVDSTYTHWGTFVWGGVETGGNVRAFFLLDRTGGAGVHDLIAAWANYINYLRANWLPGLPYVAYVLDNANVGGCGDFGITGYSFATICNRNAGGNYGRTTYVRRFEGPSSHFNGPYVDIDRSLLPTALAQQNLINHELGHLLGLGHSSNPASIMCVPACGFPPPGERPALLYDRDDGAAFAFLYGAHSVSTEPF